MKQNHRKISDETNRNRSKWWSERNNQKNQKSKVNKLLREIKSCSKKHHYKTSIKLKAQKLNQNTTNSFPILLIITNNLSSNNHLLWVQLRPGNLNTQAHHLHMVNNILDIDINIFESFVNNIYGFFLQILQLPLVGLQLLRVGFLLFFSELHRLQWPGRKTSPQKFFLLQEPFL